MANSNLAVEFEKYLSQFKTQVRPEHVKGHHYIGGGKSKLFFKDLKTSEVRSTLKQKFSVHELNLVEKLDQYELVWFSSNIFEVKIIPLYWVNSLSDDELIQICPRLLAWSAEIDNWALSDGLCCIYSRILEKKPSMILPALKKWNKSSEPWLQRISLISLFYYSRSRKKQPSFNLVVAFIKPHFNSKDYYVQKAVGWTLRELYNAYPKLGLNFIEKNVGRIAPAAWYAASEKLKPAVKNKLLKKRKLSKKILNV